MNWGSPRWPRCLAVLGAAGAYNRFNGKSRRAGRVADGVVVPVMAVDNTTRPEGRAPAVSRA